MRKSLTSRAFRDVPDADRGRGSSYQRTGRVRLGEVTADGAEARVLGTSSYGVTIDWREAEAGRLRAHCDCPRFAEAAVCKHVWAVVLEIDDAGFSDLVPGNGPLRLGALDGGGPFDDQDVEPAAAAPRRLPPSPSPWRRHLSKLHDALALDTAMGTRIGAEQEIWFVADLAATRARGHLVIGFFRRRRKRSGEWSRLQSLAVDSAMLHGLPAGEERALLELLRMVPYNPWYTAVAGSVDRVQAGVLSAALHEQVLPRLAATGRFLWSPGGGTPPELTRTLSWDAGEPWRFRLVAERPQETGGLRLRGELYRGETTVPLSEPLLLTAAGLVIFPGTMARLDAEADFPWVLLLRESREVIVPPEEEAEALADLWALPRLPAIAGSVDLALREER